MISEMLNQFAVVSYVHGPLARFVDGLRCELTPGCPHKAHVTILPPRSLSIPTEQAIEECRQIVSTFHPFLVRIRTVSLFQSTHVLKLEVEQGANELRTLHDLLAPDRSTAKIASLHPAHHPLQGRRSGACARDPRAGAGTLGPVGSAAELWIDTLTFVQQRADQTWVDLDDLTLGESVPVRSMR
ncbi:MAG: hypothetical protein R2724_05995 [Bryobacterales bacterium]